MSLLRLQQIGTLAAGAALISGCAGHGAALHARSPLSITERDFHLSVASRPVTAGLTQLTVRNQGPDDHELIIVRQTSRSAALPLRGDGVTVDEEKLATATVGSGLVPGQPGSVRSLAVNLTPGRYVLFCNMSGHYLGGMHADLVVQ